MFAGPIRRGGTIAVIDKPKKKKKKPIQKTRTPMPEQDPKVRAKNFDEVPLGYSPEQARKEGR